MVLCSPKVGSALSSTRSILIIRLRLTGMATPSLSLLRVLSVANCNVYGPVLRDNSLRLRSVAVSFKLPLYPMTGSAVSLSERRTLRGGRPMFTLSPRVLLSEIGSTCRNLPCTFFLPPFCLSPALSGTQLSLRMTSRLYCTVVMHSYNAGGSRLVRHSE